MSADVAARLRALTQDYHEGRLNLAAYRALRAPLLDSLVAAVPSAADMDITRPRAVRPATAAPVEDAPGGVQPPGRRPFGPVLIALALAALAGGALVWLFVGGGGPADNVAAVSDSSVPAGNAATSLVYATVVAFTERNDWSDARLATLNASLLEAGEHEIALIAREDGFHRFVDELRKHLKERQALASTPLTPDNSAIAALAVTVGLDLNSPDAAIRIASVEVPAASPAEADHAKGERAGARVFSDAKRERPHGGGAAHDEAAPGTARSAHAGGGSEHGESLRDAATSGDAAVGTTSAPAMAGGAATSDTAGGPALASAPAGAGNAPSGSRDSSSNGAASPKAGNGLAPGAGAGASSAVIASAPATPGDATRDGACRVELIRSRRPLCTDVLPAGEGPLLALLPAGSFEMGSTAASEEQPLRRVTIGAPFAISVNEISQGEFRLFCENTGRSFPEQPWTGDDYPVVNVTWSEARAYAEWLSSVTHSRYHLPSEAQWEYAARAGQTGPFPGGDTLSPTDAHFSTATKQNAPARRSEKFKPNAFRLLHTIGNVREWVDDAWVPSYAGAPTDGSAVKTGAAAGMRVARGGSYADGSARLRLSLREGLPENTRDSVTGFRVARELP
jgi:formylglycine-generating enzyme required for sulfatase activity